MGVSENPAAVEMEHHVEYETDEAAALGHQLAEQERSLGFVAALTLHKKIVFICEHLLIQPLIPY